MATFTQGCGDWTQYRQLPNMVEIDFHYGSERHMPWHERTAFTANMQRVYDEALRALKEAYEAGKDFVLFRHGASTSRPGAMTARSQVRGLMRSREATSYIDRKRCIQHETVFIAAIRKKAH